MGYRKLIRFINSKRPATLGFDPYLPELPQVFDCRAIARLFEEHWPDLASHTGAPVAIRSCRPSTTKYWPSERCVTTYVLTVEPPGQAAYPTIGVIETTPAGLAPRLFHDDAQLPWLVQAADPAAMLARFSALLKGRADQGRPETCTVTPVRYHPGTRCTLRYDLRLGQGQRTFFGKVLHKNGARLMASMQMLYERSQVEPEMPRVPRPLAYWSELHMLVTQGVEADRLRDRLFDASEAHETRQQWMRDVGLHLAALHACPSIEGRRHRFEHALRSLSPCAAPMSAANPALATRFEALLEEAARFARGRAEPPAVVSHGAFRLSQCWIHKRCLVLIDVDTVGWANPALDVGGFLASLDWHAIRQPRCAASAEHAKRTFLASYREKGAALDERWLALYHAAALLELAGRSFRSLTFRKWPHLPWRVLDAAQAKLRT